MIGPKKINHDRITRDTRSVDRDMKSEWQHIPNPIHTTQYVITSQHDAKLYINDNVGYVALYHVIYSAVAGLRSTLRCPSGRNFECTPMYLLVVCVPPPPRLSMEPKALSETLTDRQYMDAKCDISYFGRYRKLACAIDLVSLPINFPIADDNVCFPTSYTDDIV